MKYAAGGKLVEHGDLELVYDARRRLVERRKKDDPKAPRWNYEWNAAGLLSTVTAPDGTKSSFEYDCFARRIGKRVERPNGQRSFTRFVWSSDELMHELREDAKAKGDPIVEERTYVELPETMAIFAERRRQRSDTALAGDWRFVLLDDRHSPELFVDANGKVVEELALTAFGEAEKPVAPGATHARFAGQWYDEETGLHYNRYRYYDPSTGRYISPEPLGLEGGLQPFTYADNNPFEIIDPNGLKGMRATASGGGAEGVGRSSSSPAPGGKKISSDQAAKQMHPVVAGALSKQRQESSRSGGGRRPEACAEPRAVSDYLYKWQAKNPGKPLDPDTKQGRKNIKKALGQMEVQARQQNNKRKRAPCRNCSQFFANLMEQYGAPNPDNIKKGFKSARGKTKQQNFTPPKKGKRGYRSYKAALDANAAK